MTKALEFENRNGVNHVTGGTFEAAVLRSLPNSPELFTDQITIDGSVIDLPPEIIHRLIPALFAVRQLIEGPQAIPMDCLIFGTALSGGTVNPDTFAVRAFPFRITGFYRQVSPLGSAPNVTRVFEPTIMGKLVEDDSALSMHHTVVALDPKNDIYIQKLGKGNIAIMGIQETTKLYDCDTLGSCVSLGAIDAEGNEFLRFAADDLATVTFSPISTLVFVS